MFESLFGSEMPLAARFFIAFLVVLGLIGVTAWVVRRFGAGRLGGASTRGRQPRLAVIDAAPVDGRRRLVLIRRDNIEHLLMIGGPTDVVVEQNIVRAAARETQRVGMPDLPARSASADTAWPLQPSNEPAVAVAPARGYRGAVTEEPWLAPEPGARPRPSESLGGFASEPPRFAPDFGGPARSEPVARAPIVPPAPPVEPEPGPIAEDDHNLADMALQLEAALRRAPAAEGRPPVTDPLARPPEPAVASRDFKPRFEPKFDLTAEPKSEPPKFESKPEAKPAPAAKNIYDNLEEEMANLLGRPPGKP